MRYTLYNPLITSNIILVEYDEECETCFDYIRKNRKKYICIYSSIQRHTEPGIALPFAKMVANWNPIKKSKYVYLSLSTVRIADPVLKDDENSIRASARFTSRTCSSTGVSFGIK